LGNRIRSARAILNLLAKKRNFPISQFQNFPIGENWVRVSEKMNIRSLYSGLDLGI
jgi:hypothetical protein